ncbi:hypothetical protein GEV43_44825 [Actinomadura sp. J1-007]|uniref:PIG-L deacetylase family protein n=1 Tax=Actinomadura sp. J1-007 TaxID=2661913 RepID=UPI00132A1985|nr:hypothetical protein [Actinomadura sp. J1-007]MWK40372.1 hypothetical protein [Actinomadura sp. J1-007]
MIVVSPHLDDAALSAWARLAAGNVMVITVFTGRPPAAFTVSSWDLETGATCSHQRMRERLAEDDRALGGLGVPTVRLGQVEFEYRSGGDADVAAIAEGLRRYLAGCGELWLPAGIGAHPDHIAARDAGLLALMAAPGLAARFYADFPYVAEDGWPSWITTATRHGTHALVCPESTELCPLRFGDVRPTARITVLDPDERAAKTSTLRNYRSQLCALGLTDEELARSSRMLNYELSWSA